MVALAECDGPGRIAGARVRRRFKIEISDDVGMTALPHSSMQHISLDVRKGSAHIV